jgi:dethiobiotin synthetase
LAARAAGDLIKLSEVAAWIAEQEQNEAPSISLVELAGGAFSPLAPGVTNVDLALTLAPAVWLLVAPDALGVLHDLGATLRALPRPPDAVVLSRSRPRDASTGTNAPELEALGTCSVLEVLDAGAREAATAVEWLKQRQDFSPRTK